MKLSTDEPRQVVAQAREVWQSSEMPFARVTRLAPWRVEAVPSGGHMLAESGPAETASRWPLGRIVIKTELGIRSQQLAHSNSFDQTHTF